MHPGAHLHIRHSTLANRPRPKMIIAQPGPRALAVGGQGAPSIGNLRLVASLSVYKIAHPSVLFGHYRWFPWRSASSSAHSIYLFTLQIDLRTETGRFARISFQ